MSWQLKGENRSKARSTGSGTKWGSLIVFTLHFFPPSHASFCKFHWALGMPRWYSGAPGLRQSIVPQMRLRCGKTTSSQQSGFCRGGAACWETRVSSLLHWSPRSSRLVQPLNWSVYLKLAASAKAGSNILARNRKRVSALKFEANAYIVPSALVTPLGAQIACTQPSLGCLSLWGEC